VGSQSRLRRHQFTIATTTSPDRLEQRSASLSLDRLSSSHRLPRSFDYLRIPRSPDSGLLTNTPAVPCSYFPLFFSRSLLSSPATCRPPMQSLCRSSTSSRLVSLHSTLGEAPMRRLTLDISTCSYETAHGAQLHSRSSAYTSRASWISLRAHQWLTTSRCRGRCVRSECARDKRSSRL
jgi:hypothetical protein